jgi:hypothetical protein
MNKVCQNLRMLKNSKIWGRPRTGKLSPNTKMLM